MPNVRDLPGKHINDSAFLLSHYFVFRNRTKSRFLDDTESARNLVQNIRKKLRWTGLKYNFRIDNLAALVQSSVRKEQELFLKKGRFRYYLWDKKHKKKAGSRRVVPI